MRRRLRVVSYLMGLALAASACTATLSDEPTSAGTSTQSGQSGDTTPQREHTVSLRGLSANEQATLFVDYYTQTITWGPCEGYGVADHVDPDELSAAGMKLSDIECAQISAPEDWRRPTSPQSITLTLSRIPAKGASKGVILGNPGGPGDGGTWMWLTHASHAPDLRAFDLIGFDPRGIGLSSPVTCQSNAEDIGEQLAECAQEDPLVESMGTLQVARDMELMRHLLGQEKTNFLGYSYGTILGATYATLFPEKTGRMVLDSAENSAWASPLHSAEQTLAIAASLQRLGQRCQTIYQPEGLVSACPFVDDTSLQAILVGLDDTPLVGTRMTIGSDEFLTALIDTLYYPDADRALLLDLIAGALAGDQESIDGLVEFIDLQSASEEDPDAPGQDAQSAGAGEEPEHDLSMQIVTCHSTPRGNSRPQVEERLKDITLPAFLTLEDLLPVPGEEMCDHVPFTGSDITDSFSAPSVAEPLLVIGITGDHATPYVFADDLVEELGLAVLLTVEGDSHAVSFSGQSACVDQTVSAYFTSGKLPEAGARCQLDPPAILESAN